MSKLLERFGASGKPLRTDATPSLARLWRAPLASVLWLFVAVLGPGDAHAEATPLTVWRGGGLTLYVNHPNVADDGGRIDCAPGTSGCLPLNLAACDGPGLPVEFTLSSPLSQPAPTYTGGTQTLYAFLSPTANCIYSSNTSQIADNGILIGSNPGLPSSSVFFQNGSLPVNMPGVLPALSPNFSLGNSQGVLTTTALMNAFGVCPNAGGQATNLRSMYLCVGIDGSGSKGGVNNASVASATNNQPTQTQTPFGGQPTTQTSSTDLVGFLALQVDTQPPAAPTQLLVTPKNGRARVKVAYDASQQDVYSLELHYTSAPADVADANNAASGNDCLSWQAAQVASQIVRGQADGNKVFDVGNLQNGVDYAFCAVTTDYLRNISGPSVVATARPRHECDLFECYSGDLKVGFCAATDLPALWTLAASGAAWATCRRRRRTAWGKQKGAGPRAQRSSSCSLILLLIVGLWPLSASSASAAPWIKSEPPVTTQRGRPPGEAPDPLGAERAAERHSPISFGDPRHEVLDYAAKPPMRTVGAVEFGLGPFRPSLGRGQLAELYNLIYRGRRHGTLFPGRPLRYRLSGSYLPFRTVHTGPYAAISLWAASAPSRLCTDASGTPVDCSPATVFASSEGTDTATLMVMPLTVGWLYAQDLQRWLRVPLSVLVRAGLVHNLWWGRSGGRAATYREKAARGSTVNGEVGIQLALDVSALTRRTKDSRTHALLFAELDVLPNGAMWGSDRRHRLSLGTPAFVLVGLRAQFRAEH